MSLQPCSPEPQRLPTELLGMIFQFLTSDEGELMGSMTRRRLVHQPTLRSMTNVSRSWYAVATRHLYQDIYITSYSALSILSVALRDPKNAHLPDLVRSFTMTNSMFGGVSTGYTTKDERNLQSIYEVCPHLVPRNYKVYARPGSELTHYGTQVVDIHNITRLEMCFPNRHIVAQYYPIFGPLKEFPTLQELILFKPECEPLVWYNYLERFTPPTKLPEMPQLRRLSIIHLETRHYHIPNSPLLHTLEFIDCYIRSMDDVKRTIQPLHNSLETLVLTGATPRQLSFNHIDPESFKYLANLCLPLCAFLGDGLFPLPPSLRSLHVAEERMSDYELVSAVRRTMVLLCSKCGLVNDERKKWPQFLKELRISARDIERPYDMIPTTVKLAEALGVKFDFLISRKKNIWKLLRDNTQMGIPSAVPEQHHE